MIFVQSNNLQPKRVYRIYFVFLIRIDDKAFCQVHNQSHPYSSRTSDYKKLMKFLMVPSSPQTEGVE